jgi:DNA polymerase-3 subunit delta'
LEQISIYRQDRIRKKIEREIDQDRLAPSLIFHGLPGVGKERMAFFLAQSILCLENGNGACGECAACRKIDKLLHPDVQWLFPRPGSIKDDEIEKIVNRKSSETFFRPIFGKTASHSLEAIRNLRTISGKRPYEGNAKVFIVTEGDRMTVEGSNAFLKLLEEPPDDTMIIITTSRIHALLPTIRSRCEEIRFSPLPMQELRSVLVEELDIKRDTADQLSRNSEGSLGRAVRMWKEEEKDGWNDAWDIFQLASIGSEEERFEYILVGPLQRDRERIRNALEILVSLLRDLIVVELGLSEEELINISRHDLLKTCEGIPLEGTIKSVKKVEELKRLLDRNVSSSILLWRLLHDLTLNLTSPLPSRNLSSRTD